MNDREKLGRLLLEEAIRQYEETYCDAFPESTDEISYSENYKREIRKIGRKSKNPFLKSLNTTWKRVSTIAAAFLLVFGCMMSVSAVRKPIVRFFVEVGEQIIRLSFTEDAQKTAPEVIEKMYLITALPENSNWLTQFINDKDITTTWANEHVNVTLIQSTLDSEFFANPDPSLIVYKEMAGYDVAIFRTFSVTIYIWNTEEYVYHLVIKGHLRDEECETMIESLTPWKWTPEMKGSFINEN